jgi:hypothetical protein
MVAGSIKATSALPGRGIIAKPSSGGH